MDGPQQHGLILMQPESQMLLHCWAGCALYACEGDHKGRISNVDGIVMARWRSSSAFQESQPLFLEANFCNHVKHVRQANTLLPGGACGEGRRLARGLTTC